MKKAIILLIIAVVVYLLFFRKEKTATAGTSNSGTGTGAGSGTTPTKPPIFVDEYALPPVLPEKQDPAASVDTDPLVIQSQAIYPAKPSTTADISPFVQNPSFSAKK